MSETSASLWFNNFLKYAKEWEDLLSLEIELEIKFPIDLDEISDAKLTPGQINLIDVFIKKEEE